MILINQLKLPVEHREADIKNKIIKELNLRRIFKDMPSFEYKIVRRSIDARKKPEIYYIYSVCVSFSDSLKTDITSNKTDVRNTTEQNQNKKYKRDTRDTRENNKKQSNQRDSVIKNNDSGIKNNEARKTQNHYELTSIERTILKKCGNKNVAEYKPCVYEPQFDVQNKPGKRPVIIGEGPAGLFTGLILAYAGYRPVILERGDKVDKRVEKVRDFWLTGSVDENTNVQFGEGGAGTFSDGKLNTLVKDKTGKNQFVLDSFVRFGANPECAYDAKPHVGTDVLADVVRNMRNEIIDHGGHVLNLCKLTDIVIQENAVKSIIVDNFNDPEDYSHEVIAKLLEGNIVSDSNINTDISLNINKKENTNLEDNSPKECIIGSKNNSNQEINNYCTNALNSSTEFKTTYKIDADDLILATGHSARDTFRMLLEKNADMQQKNFAVGVRIQHPQKMINDSQYGKGHSDLLPPAPYKLTNQTEKGRSVFSFCMCPGGYVVNASSIKGHLCVNGMSYSDRASENANSAIIVGIDREDFGSDDVLAGMILQERLETKAYELANGKIPVQLFKDFKDNKASESFGSVNPVFKGDYGLTNLRELFPEEVSLALIESINKFGYTIEGFDDPDAVIAAVESRTSSPVRITRDETFQSNIKGLYPCGEGAGYAGGIMSAAMDGIKVAEAVITKYDRERIQRSVKG